MVVVAAERVQVSASKVPAVHAGHGIHLDDGNTALV